MFLFVIGFANFGLPFTLRFLTGAYDCYQTDPTKPYGYAPTGRPCPDPKYVAKLPYQTSTTTEKGILPNEINVNATSPLNTVLYLVSFPFFVFSVLSIVGTCVLWVVLKLKQTR